MRKFNRSGQRGKGHFLAFSETKFGPLLALNSTFLLRRTWGYVVQHYSQKNVREHKGAKVQKKLKKCIFFWFFCFFVTFVPLCSRASLDLRFRHMGIWRQLGKNCILAILDSESENKTIDPGICRPQHETTSRSAAPNHLSRAQARMTWVTQGNSLKLVLVLVPVAAAGADNREFFFFLYIAVGGSVWALLGQMSEAFSSNPHFCWFPWLLCPCVLGHLWNSDFGRSPRGSEIGAFFLCQKSPLCSRASFGTVI